MELKLHVSKDDPAFEEGGILADKTWIIGESFAVTVHSGFYDGSQVDRPHITMHENRDLWQRPDLRKIFDIGVFEKALQEARARVVEIDNFIAAKIAELRREK